MRGRRFGPLSSSGKKACRSAVFLAVLALAPVATAAPGDLDPSFGGDGTVTTSFADAQGSYDDAWDLVVQPDGKIVAVGSNYPPYQLELARYTREGSLDPSFGEAGQQTTDVGRGYAQAVALQPDGKLVVAGAARADFPRNDLDFAIFRYDANAILDASFSDDGKQITDFSGEDAATDVAVQPDGKIVVLGSDEPYSSAGTDFSLARYNTDGRPDTGFSDDGKLMTHFAGGGGYAGGLALQPDGKIVAAGAAGGQFAVARWHPDGSPDMGFSDDGKLTTAFGPSPPVSAYGNDLVVQPDGGIVVVGGAALGGGDDFAVARYKPNGSLDPAFSGDGKLTTNTGDSAFDAAQGVALQGDGKILAAGSAVVRYTADGNLDLGFGGDGIVTTPSVFARSVALQSDGRIVTGGTFFANEAGGFRQDFAVTRYLGGDAPASPGPPAPVQPSGGTGGHSGGGGGGAGAGGLNVALIRAALAEDLQATARALELIGIRGLLKRRGFTVRGLDALMPGTFTIALTAMDRPASTVSSAGPRITVAKARRSAARAGKLKVKARLTKRGLRLLRRAARVRVRLGLTFTPESRASVRKTRQLTLTR